MSWSVLSSLIGFIKVHQCRSFKGIKMSSICVSLSGSVGFSWQSPGECACLDRRSPAFSHGKEPGLFFFPTQWLCWIL